MRVRRLKISNFRGVAEGVIDFAGHTLLVGGNNIGKSTVCEALDLILGPERLYRRPVVDEHDFYCGRYIDDQRLLIEIRLEAILLDLSDEARRRFHRHLRRWDDAAGVFIDEEQGGLEAADGEAVVWALPLVFVGRYDQEEDDFIGNTFFDHPLGEEANDDEGAQSLYES
jgi:putative ATP-dependent endonuclease of OLD family